MFVFQSGNGDKSGRSSRLSSASSVADEDFTTNQSNAISSPSENGELDYKKVRVVLFFIVWLIIDVDFL